MINLLLLAYAESNFRR